jgi:hypothetical protein
VVSALYHSLYSYQLNAALGLIRTMCYLGMNDTMTFKHALEFVLRQQRLDESIGLFASEIEKLQKMNSTLNPELDLYLPTTVSFMHTTAEAIHHRFLLFQSV